MVPDRGLGHRRGGAGMTGSSQWRWSCRGGEDADDKGKEEAEEDGNGEAGREGAERGLLLLPAGHGTRVHRHRVP